jgi:hypothetical protein
MTFEDQQRLNGWHAAEAGEVFDFRQPKTWQQGHMLWTATHIAAPFLSLPPQPLNVSSKAASSSGSQPK